MKKPKTLRWKLKYTAKIDFSTYVEMKIVLEKLEKEPDFLSLYGLGGLCDICKEYGFHFLNRFIRSNYLIIGSTNSMFMDSPCSLPSRIYFLKFHIEAYKDKRDLHPLVYWLKCLIN